MTLKAPRAVFMYLLLAVCILPALVMLAPAINDRSTLQALAAMSAPIALFSISFSFLEYQFSPYRTLLGSMPVALRTVAGVLVLVALIPPLLAALGSDARFVLGTWGASVVLALAFGAHVAAKASVANELRVRTSNRRLQAFEGQLHEAAADAAAVSERAFEALDRNVPSHEHDWYPHLGEMKNDPFPFLQAIVGTAAKESDVRISDLATERLVYVADLVISRCGAASLGYRDRKVVEGHVSDGVSDFMSLVASADKSGIVFARSLRIIGGALERAARSRETYSPDVRLLRGALVNGAAQLLERGRSSDAITCITEIRRAAEAGCRRAGRDQTEAHNLSAYGAALESLALRGLEPGDLDFTYRCLQALAWLGCTAVRNDLTNLAAACAGGIAQVGREARAKGVACYWDGCPVSVDGHAMEHLEWLVQACAERMTTESEAAGSEQRSPDVPFVFGPVRTALSRLTGRVHIARAETAQGQARLVVEATQKPHVEQLMTGSGGGEFDYSDFTMVTRQLLRV